MLRIVGKANRTVEKLRTKTEHRISFVVNALKNAAPGRLTYDDLVEKTGTNYDVLLYIMGTLVEVGLVERTEVGGSPGRPKVYFQWKKRSKAAQAVGA